MRGAPHEARPEPLPLTRRRGRLHRRPQKIRAEERLDGKFLLRSDDSLSADDIALGYKQLIEVERGWRTLKHTLDLRPVYHRKDDRIRAHVLLCFLALLLTRLAETQRRDLAHSAASSKIHLGTFTGPAGTSGSAPS